jgi:C4-dicarboxylate-specific signal transduction histidine kinase
VPLVKDNEIVGYITLGRKQVQPFTDKQISLFRDFAAQATIALESTRSERQYREMQSELAHANRVAAMGQLTASIAHEVSQPLTGVLNSGHAALRWLASEPPDLEASRRSIERVIKEATRAGDVISGLRALVKKAPPRTESFDMNEAIRNVIVLTHREAVK